MSYSNLGLSWLRSWSPRGKRPVRRPTGRTVKPWLEVLEDRLAPTVSPTHLYDLNGTYDDLLGGQALVADGGTLDSGRYTFQPNQGLRLSGALTDTTNYSIRIVAELDSLSANFFKIVDFQNRSSDDGVYFNNNHVLLYPGDAGSGEIQENTDFELLLTRNGVTGETRLYLDGVLQEVYTGAASSAAISANNMLIFFEDDTISGTFEAMSGSVDSIAIYDVVLNPDDTGEQENGVPTVTADLAEVTVNEGQNAVNTGSWRDPDFEAVTLVASSGTLIQNANGTWSWSFATTDGQDQSQTVTIVATDVEGATASTTFSLVVNNVAPTVNSDQATVAFDVNHTAVNSGTWSDPGDDIVALVASIGTLTQNANGTWSWSFVSGTSEAQSVTITATDSDGAVSSTTFSVVNDNTPPTITSLVSNHATEQNISSDGCVQIVGAFTDPDLLDTHTVVINWGDGSLPQTLDPTTAHTFSASHHYAGGGVYTISTTVTDSHGATDTMTTTAIVSGVRLVDGTLYIIGTNGYDRVSIESLRNGELLRVNTTFPISPCGQTTMVTFASAAIHDLVILTGGGNDTVQINKKIVFNDALQSMAIKTQSLFNGVVHGVKSQLNEIVAKIRPYAEFPGGATAVSVQQFLGAKFAAAGNGAWGLLRRIWG